MTSLMRACDNYFLSIFGMVSDLTLRSYKHHLSVFCDFLGPDFLLADLSIDHLRRYRMHLFSQDKKYCDHPIHSEISGSLSIYTVRNSLQTVKTFLKFCVDDGYISSNPAASLKFPPIPKTPKKGISPADIQKLLDVSEFNIRDHAIILFLADTGCRVGGLTSLTWPGIDFNLMSAFITEKGPKSRLVYFGDQTSDALLRLKKISQDISGPVFRTLRCDNSGCYSPLTSNAIYQLLRRLAKKAGVNSDFNPHSFRHAVIRGWLSNGMPLSLASQLAGHSSLSITSDIYGSAGDFELSKAHQNYSHLV